MKYLQVFATCATFPIVYIEMKFFLLSEGKKKEHFWYYFWFLCAMLTAVQFVLFECLLIFSI